MLPPAHRPLQAVQPLQVERRHKAEVWDTGQRTPSASGGTPQTVAWHRPTPRPARRGVRRVSYRPANGGGHGDATEETVQCEGGHHIAGGPRAASWPRQGTGRVMEAVAGGDTLSRRPGRQPYIDSEERIDVSWPHVCRFEAAEQVQYTTIVRQIQAASAGGATGTPPRPPHAPTHEASPGPRPRRHQRDHARSGPGCNASPPLDSGGWRGGDGDRPSPPTRRS